MHDSVTVHMEASPDEVWGLVSDITNTGRFSPETLEAEWLDGANGPAVGARFRGHVKRNGRGPMYWTTCKVTVSDPGREFTFDVVGPGDRTINTWGYRFEPADGPATLCAIAVETDDKTGLAKKVAPVRLGGILDQADQDPADTREQALRRLLGHYQHTAETATAGAPTEGPAASRRLSG